MILDMIEFRPRYFRILAFRPRDVRLPAKLLEKGDGIDARSWVGTLQAPFVRDDWAADLDILNHQNSVW